MTALHQQGSPSLQADIGERATEPTERPAICWVAASICRMARDPIARPGMRTLALICELLPRRRPAPVMAAPAHPRRSDRRVWAGQCPMASCGAVSMAAKRSGGCWGLIQINAATRLPPKVVHGIKTDFQHRSCRDRHHRSQRGGCARRHPVVRLVNAAGPDRAVANTTPPRAPAAPPRFAGSST